MRTKRIETKNWVLFLPLMTQVEYDDAQQFHNYPGLCILCGFEASGVEPDAREYECECCGERGVYGLEELLIAGCIIWEEPK